MDIQFIVSSPTVSSQHTIPLHRTVNNINSIKNIICRKHVAAVTTMRMKNTCRVTHACAVSDTYLDFPWYFVLYALLYGVYIYTYISLQRHLICIFVVFVDFYLSKNKKLGCGYLNGWVAIVGVQLLAMIGMFFSIAALGDCSFMELNERLFLPDDIDGEGGINLPIDVTQTQYIGFLTWKKLDG